MFKLPLLLLLLPVLVLSKCPNNWQQYGNLCYFFSTMVASWNAAEQICMARGGHLASIHSAAQNNFIIHEVVKGQIVNNTWYNAYLGGYWNATVKKWQWTDGSPMNYSHWDSFIPPFIPKSDDAHHSIVIGTTNPSAVGWWGYNEDAHGNYVEGFICQVPLCDANGKMAPSLINQNMTGLELAYMANSNSWFYGCPYCLARTYINSDAEVQCQTIGAHLPSVHNAYQNAELMSALNKICKTVYQDVSYMSFTFGLVSNATGSDWRFFDGTPLIYTNWEVNQPMKFSHTAYSWIDGNDGKWFTEYHTARSYGCQIRMDVDLCQ